jgi:hypothetical protein
VGGLRVVTAGKTEPKKDGHEQKLRKSREGDTSIRYSVRTA